MSSGAAAEFPLLALEMRSDEFYRFAALKRQQRIEGITREAQGALREGTISSGSTLGAQLSI
jgi:hypothetical protein